MNETVTNAGTATTQVALSHGNLLSPENIDRLIQFGLNLLFAVLILIIGAWVAKLIKSMLTRALNHKKLDPIIVGFLANLTYIIVLIAVVMAALNKLSIQTTSLVAIVGAAGLAIGLALQGSLANFAAGFLMVIFRPFKKGDYIEAGGTAGVVDEIQVFTTILNTPDNRRVIVPNSKIMGDNITNYSAKDSRRLDLIFGVSYSDNIPKVKEVLQRVVSEDPRVLKEPAAQILVGELADSSVNFIMRVWIKSSDYWPFKFETTEKVKMTFDQEGISIPFPQRDVHMFQAK
ncbi:MAG TPA: mechanosensitive ion channel domain-containing protein [Verrucomicrobiae bacterium]|nr:mechanosensitive ion channel domain-containing protein [Verrucomicrobiae bacterium]